MFFSTLVTGNFDGKHVYNSHQTLNSECEWVKLPLRKKKPNEIRYTEVKLSFNFFFQMETWPLNV
jgi:hypothetical protein